MATRSKPAMAAVAVAGFILIPTLGAVRTHPDLHTPELAQLSAWARSSTPRDAVFLFPDAGKQLYPGIFRSEAQRAVYVDWKGGGQVNYLPQFGEQWWSRWQIANQLLSPAEYRKIGIDYLVVRPGSFEPGVNVPVFTNSQFVVFRLQT